MHRLRKILREIHRRALWQVLGVYVAGSWAVLQVVDSLTRVAGLPGWTPGLAFVLLLIGLPVVAVTAFVQEGLPSLRGEYRDEVDPNVLEGRTPEQVHVDPAAHPLYRERLFTWKNAILGGVGAATLLVASVIAYVGMWAAGVGPMGNLVAQGVLAQGDAVLVADFADATGEGLGGVVTQALRVHLSQGEILRVVDGAAAGEGIEVVLEGAVASTGSGYVVSAALRAPASGLTLATFRASAESSDDVISALDRLSQDIREKSGESLRTIRAGAPLDAVTTASLEAFRLYVASGGALDRGEETRAVELLREAVSLDPAFAMAWRLLAVVLADAGLDPEGMVEAATRAYEHRARLPEGERALAESFYRARIAPRGSAPPGADRPKDG